MLRITTRYASTNIRIIGIPFVYWYLVILVSVCVSDYHRLCTPDHDDGLFYTYCTLF